MTGREAEIELDGGVLHDRWDDRTGHVFMTGPAAFVSMGNTRHNTESEEGP